jgi:hypothetical protein
LCKALKKPYNIYRMVTNQNEMETKCKRMPGFSHRFCGYHPRNPGVSAEKRPLAGFEKGRAIVYNAPVGTAWVVLPG